MKRKVIKSFNMILACITTISMFFITPSNVFAAEQTTSINLEASQKKTSSLKDAIYL